MGFFVVEHGPSPPGFYDIVVSINNVVSDMSRSRLVGLYSSFSTRAVRVEYVAPSRFAVYSEDLYESVKRSYLAPAMFNSYRACARSLAIEILEVMDNGRVVVSVENLRSMLRGLLVHKAYYEGFAVGRTEVPVVSDRERIYGVVDELREYQNTPQVYEVKSGFNPDLVGAGLQVMAYMLALSDANAVPLGNVEGYIVTPRATYRVYFDEAVFREYRRRVERVVEIARSRLLTQLPPRLGDSKRCSSCPYRGPCSRLPDKYRTYERFFREQGFEKLRKNNDSQTLFDYSS